MLNEICLFSSIPLRSSCKDNFFLSKDMYEGNTCLKMGERWRIRYEITRENGWKIMSESLISSQAGKSCRVNCNCKHEKAVYSLI